MPEAAEVLAAESPALEAVTSRVSRGRAVIAIRGSSRRKVRALHWMKHLRSHPWRCCRPRKLMAIASLSKFDWEIAERRFLFLLPFSRPETVNAAWIPTLPDANVHEYIAKVRQPLSRPPP